MYDLAEFDCGVSSDQRVHVIGHNAPSMQGVARSVAMQQRFGGDARAARITQERRAKGTVEHVVAGSFAERNGIEKSKDDMLADVAPIKMGKVSAPVPAL